MSKLSTDVMDRESRLLERARRGYARKGYTGEWTEKRVHSMAVRGQLTREWRGRGITDGADFSKLTRLLHEETFGLPMEEHRAIKGIVPGESLRDSMTPLELMLTSLAEETAKALAQGHDSHDVAALERDAHAAAAISRMARREIERRLDRPVVTARRPWRNAVASAQTGERRAA